jgi:hypothetical protein
MVVSFIYPGFVKKEIDDQIDNQHKDVYFTRELALIFPIFILKRHLNPDLNI